MTLSAKQAIERADLALSDLSSDGGILAPKDADRFIDFIYDAPTLLQQVRQIRMSSHSQKVQKIGFGQRILKPSPGSLTELDAADRSKPTTSEIEMTTEELVAEVNLPYDVLEDNIEGENLAETIMRHIAIQVAVDMEEFALQGDSASSDPYLALMDGWLKRANVNLLNAGGASIDEDMLENLIQTVPAKYRRILSAYKFYTHDKIARRWTHHLAARGTSLGDNALVNGGEQAYSGVKVAGLDLMPEASSQSQILLANPQNLLFGIWRQIRIEKEKAIRRRGWVIVVSLRAGMQIEEVNALGKATAVSTAQA